MRRKLEVLLAGYMGSDQVALVEELSELRRPTMAKIEDGGTTSWLK